MKSIDLSLAAMIPHPHATQLADGVSWVQQDTAEARGSPRGGISVALLMGNLVHDPRRPEEPREGVVITVTRHPMCLARLLTIAWKDTGTLEELDEREFGEMDD